jgi:hypothetical protein
MAQSISVAPRRVSRLQAAVRLGVHQSVVTNLIKSGQLAVIEIPGMRTAVSESSLEALIEQMNGQAGDKQAQAG